MKTLYLVIFFLLSTFIHANAQTPENDLSIFLGKLQTYVATHPRHIKPNMPIAKPEPENPPADMPALDVSGYMEDPETGLRYYAAYDKVVDPVTRYSFHVATGKITLEPIKEKDTAYNGQ
ncbi:hypothetical protein [Pontibacter pamirensis]|uniref:hypothetical protein n=1 Tax=Pontibacter pamirensis TaxID=2562824 RepID=UPI00138A370B|nr:hypothetical protein [Pontibacter pamirensis]